MSEYFKERKRIVYWDLYTLLIIAIIWTWFIFIVGGMFYKCECEKINLIETLKDSSIYNCIDRLNAQEVNLSNINTTEYKIKFDIEGKIKNESIRQFGSSSI